MASRRQRRKPIGWQKPAMIPEVIIKCAVTGAGNTQDKHPDLPVTPAQIAAACI